MSKFLDDLLPRLQRLRMKLLRFNFKVTHIPRKELVAADLLSQKPVGQPQRSDRTLQKDLKSATIGAVQLIQASTTMMLRIRDAQQQSRIGQRLLKLIGKGWPTTLPDKLVEYSRHQSSLSIFKGLIIHCQRLWIPYSMRAEILQRLHASHMGQTKMYSLAQLSAGLPTEK